MITIGTSASLPQAIADLDRRTPVASIMRSADWEREPVEVRQRAFFSSGVTCMTLLERMKSMMDLAIRRQRTLQGEGVVPDKSLFVAEMQELAESLGLRPTDHRRGTIKDIGSRRRLELIWETNMRMAYGHSQHKIWHSEGQLRHFPAAELVRLEARRVHRDWPRRWVEAMQRLGNPEGIVFKGGRMVARFDSPIWAEISRFGLPYAPFDFNSGMGMDRLTRREAIELGVISDGDEVQPVKLDFNESLDASAPESEEFQNRLSDLTSGFVSVRGGRAAIDSSAAAPIFTKTSILYGEAHPVAHDRVNEALAQLDFVMGDGPLPYAPTILSTNIKGAPHRNGLFVADSSPLPVPSVPRPTIHLKAENPGIKLTMWHEDFHWLDHYGLPKDDNHLVASEGSSLAEVMDAIRSTEASYFLGVEGRYNPFISDYLSRDRELAARAFAQFIATETEDANSLAIIGGYLQSDTPSVKYVYWQAEDFRPIRVALRSLFSALGWLRAQNLRPLNT